MSDPIPQTELHDPTAQDFASKQERLTKELKAIAEANKAGIPDTHLSEISIRKPSAEMSDKEKMAMANLTEKYPEDQQDVLVQIGEGDSAVEVRLCGEGNNELLANAARIAVAQLEQTFGRPLNEVFPGLKIYFANDIIDGGGLALAKENAIILDTTKQSLTLREAENILVPAGILRPGDWSGVTEDPTTLAGQINFVHEVGHILDEKVNGNQQSEAFQALNKAEAPTQYGSIAPHEDYAESFMYLVNGKGLDQKREQILQNDIAKAVE